MEININLNFIHRRSYFDCVFSRNGIITHWGLINLIFILSRSYILFKCSLYDTHWLKYLLFGTTVLRWLESQDAHSNWNVVSFRSCFIFLKADQPQFSIGILCELFSVTTNGKGKFEWCSSKQIKYNRGNVWIKMHVFCR